MKNKIGVINYGIAGNIHSIKKAIERAGGDVLIISSPDDFQNVDKVVIPGVGSFKDAMSELESDGFIDALQTFDKPLLGICLGMQILSTIGYEYGEANGLNFIQGEVRKMPIHDILPHVGFNTIDVLKPNDILKDLENEEFYFMHSYTLTNFHDVSSTSTYSTYQFVSSIKKDNIYGVQFHPEKSRDAGIKLFRNFIELG